jgi:hypothetical protein
MTKIRRKTAMMQSRFYIRILQLLGVFGAGFLVACAKYGAPEPEYGAPYDGQREIRFSGLVQSEDSLQNLPGIKVWLVDEWGYDSAMAITNAAGEYDLYRYAYEGDKFKMKVKDTDSTANLGLFQDKTIDIEVSGRDYSNSEREVDVKLHRL